MPHSAPAAADAARASVPGRLQSFHPGWYAAVMGTSIVAVAAWKNPGRADSLDGAAQVTGEVILLLAAVLAVVLGVPTALRWSRHPRDAWEDFRHPVFGALYATVPGGLLALAAATAMIEPAYLPEGAVDPTVAVIGLVGGVLGFAGSLAFVTLLFSSREVSPETVNSGWFIPPVVNIIVPLVLAPLAEDASIGTRRLAVFTGYATLGIGLFLFLLFGALLFSRMTFHELPPAQLAPSLWILLGPLGVGALALLSLADAGEPLWGDAAGAVTAASLVTASLLWGFGLWWLFVAGLLFRGYLRQGPLPYGLGWWAFTFPLGAFTVSTGALARAWDLDLLEAVFVVLFLLTATAWGIVSLRTARAVRTGEVWRR